MSREGPRRGPVRVLAGSGGMSSVRRPIDAKAARLPDRNFRFGIASVDDVSDSVARGVVEALIERMETKGFGHPLLPKRIEVLIPHHAVAVEVSDPNAPMGEIRKDLVAAHERQLCRIDVRKAVSE